MTPTQDLWKLINLKQTRACVTGIAAQWWREKLSRVYLPKAQVPRELCLCDVCCPDCEPKIRSDIRDTAHLMILRWNRRAGRQAVLLSLANVRIRLFCNLACYDFNLTDEIISPFVVTPVDTVHALALPISTTNTRVVGVLALTVAFLLHGTNLKLGLRVQNTFGIFVLLVMIFIALAGQFVLLFPSLSPTKRTDNLEWANLWKDTRLEANAFVTALYNIIWCVLLLRAKYCLALLRENVRSFIGYSNANYALSEVRDPVRTIKKAAPLAMLFVTFVYMLVNIAYFVVVSKEDILGSGRVVA